MRGEKIRGSESSREILHIWQVAIALVVSWHCSRRSRAQTAKKRIQQPKGHETTREPHCIFLWEGTLLDRSIIDISKKRVTIGRNPHKKKIKSNQIMITFWRFECLFWSLKPSRGKVQRRREGENKGFEIFIFFTADECNGTAGYDRIIIIQLEKS